MRVELAIRNDAKTWPSYAGRRTQEAKYLRRQGRIGVPEGKPLRVRVDRVRCQGHARCNALAPELFALDEFGNAHEIGDGIVPPDLQDKAWLARANCPELAIDVFAEQGDRS
jgi:ferredoxin